MLTTKLIIARHIFTEGEDFRYPPGNQVSTAEGGWNLSALQESANSLRWYQAPPDGTGDTANIEIEMKRKNTSPVIAPALPAGETGAGPSQISLVDEGEYANLTLSQCDLFEQSARSVSISCALFTQVRLCGCRLERLRLVDIRLDKCDLSNTEWLKAKINRLEILDSKLTGFKMIDADASNCKFQNCVGDLVQFHGVKFKNTAFQNCRLKQSDFRACDLASVFFTGCDLRYAEFYGARLNGADLRGSELTGIKAHPEDLKGAIIDSQQALDLSRHLASLLGMDVRDD